MNRRKLLGMGLAAPLAGQVLFEEYDPKSTLRVPGRDVKRSKFPHIDIHNHQNGMMPAEQLDRLVADMDALNMSMMVNLNGNYGEKFRAIYKNMKGRHPKRFIVFANLDFENLDAPDYRDRVARGLEEAFRGGAQGLKLFKNFGMTTRDKNGKRIAADDARWFDVFEVCAKYRAPVLIHTADPKPFWEPWDKNNERWLELKEFPSRRRTAAKDGSWEELMAESERLFRAHPKTNFISAHLRWYGNDLENLGRQMDGMPNLYTDIAAVIAELGRQPRFARQWFDKYGDRVLFGKDVWAPAEYYTYFRVLESTDEYFEYYRRRHAFWKMYGLGLSDGVLKKLYYKNALKIVPGLEGKGFPA
ncbi:MAG: amidohydrolase family protein [Acidobacteriota bacterium]|jgi:predicted TIM-barrel fold metal-dependent hydrolase